MKHTMKLQPEPFEKIKSGKKIIESRLYDSKRRQIKLGDIITFFKNPDLKESVTIKVTGLLIYPSFDSLMSDLPVSNFGSDSRQNLLEEIHQFYSESDEKEHGVLGIKIELI